MKTISRAARLNVHIRWQIRKDMEETLRIEAESFDVPWQEEDFLHCLRHRNCISMIAEHGGKVRGYMVYELAKTSIEILNMAVDPAYRRRGIGSQMVTKLVSKLSNHRRTRLFMDVRESNLAAQLFLRAQGFRCVQVKRGWYADEGDTGEDAYLFSFRLKTEEDEP